VKYFDEDNEEVNNHSVITSFKMIFDLIVLQISLMDPFKI